MAFIHIDKKILEFKRIFKFDTYFDTEKFIKLSNKKAQDFEGTQT